MTMKTVLVGLVALFKVLGYTIELIYTIIYE